MERKIILKLFELLKSNIKNILLICIISITTYFMLVNNIDIRAVTIITLVLGFITNIYATIISFVGLIPLVGPLIIKLLSIPFFWLMNALGYFTSIYAIKKGYGKEILNHRLITTMLLLGITIGYILGHLVPVR